MYLQLTQAAAHLNCSRQWVHMLIEAGKLSTTTIAGHRLVIEDELFRAMSRRRNGKKKK